MRRTKKQGCKKSHSTKKCQLEIDPKRGYCYFWHLFDFFLFRRQYNGCERMRLIYSIEFLSNEVCSNNFSPVGLFYAIFRLTDFLSDPFDFSILKTV